MDPSVEVQFKRGHHAPGGGDAPLFMLLFASGQKGQIRPLSAGHEGQTIEADLKDLRASDQSELFQALDMAHNRIVDKLLSKNPLLDPNGSNLNSLLSRIGHLNDAAADRMLKVLLKHGADINHQAFENTHGPHWKCRFG